VICIGANLSKVDGTGGHGCSLLVTRCLLGQKQLLLLTKICFIQSIGIHRDGWRESRYLVRARPKSHILRSQFALSSKFDGLRSRCSTPAEWMYFSPRSNCSQGSTVVLRLWYTFVTIWTRDLRMQVEFSSGKRANSPT
jgi:hypothetical protein